MPTKKQIPIAEMLIGRRVKVISSQNKCTVGIEGLVVNETKNTIILETKKGRKILLKNQVVLDLGGKIVSGRELIGLPHERF